MTREFVSSPAKRECVPLLIGLFGPSGGGKTYSALRLATGIASVQPGPIIVIDTEARRALHYADNFKFDHVDFRAPFGSLDYLEAIRQQAEKKPAAIIIDSMSHEHDGVGGYLRTQEAEIERLSGGDAAKKERVRMLAWSVPAQARTRMVSGIIQTGANLIFTFRSKEKTKPAKGKDGRTEMLELGWMPICGDSLVYEMTLCCLLLPRADGVPTWTSEEVGERSMMKLPQQFRDLFAERAPYQGLPLSENLGAELARWAAGEVTPHIDAAAFDAIELNLAAAAELGEASLRKFWAGLTKDEQRSHYDNLQTKHKPRSIALDNTRKSPGV